MTIMLEVGIYLDFQVWAIFPRTAGVSLVLILAMGRRRGLATKRTGTSIWPGHLWKPVIFPESTVSGKCILSAQVPGNESYYCEEGTGKQDFPCLLLHHERSGSFQGRSLVLIEWLGGEFGETVGRQPLFFD